MGGSPARRLSAAAHRRGPLPPRGQPRTCPVVVPAVTHPGSRACKSQPGNPPAPGTLTPPIREDVGVWKPIDSRRHARLPVGTSTPYIAVTPMQKAAIQRLAIHRMLNSGDSGLRKTAYA